MSNNMMISGILNEYSVSYTADGVSKKYFHPFQEAYTDQIQVFVNSIQIDQFDPATGYSLNRNLAVEGGFIEFNNPLTAGTKILICEDVAFKRVVNFFASSAFTAKDLNIEFNNVYKILGILNANSIKTLRINNSDSVQDIADLQDGLIIKKGDNVITKNFDIDTIITKLDDVSHKYDDIKVSLITAFNKISSQPATGGGNVITNALVSQNNLKDVIDIKEARKNLGLTDISTLSKLTSSYIDDSILKQNLENIENPEKARINLGIGDMATMSKADVITLIDQKIDTGFSIPTINTAVYSVNGDFTTDIDLLVDKYQPLPFGNKDFESSDDTLLFVAKDSYDLQITPLGVYILNGFISIHEAYEMVAKIQIHKVVDGTLIQTIISNHLTAGGKLTTSGACMFNEVITITEPVFLRLFIKGNNSHIKNLMLDNTLDDDYLVKFTIHRIMT